MIHVVLVALRHHRRSAMVALLLLALIGGSLRAAFGPPLHGASADTEHQPRYLPMIAHAEASATPSRTPSAQPTLIATLTQTATPTPTTTPTATSTATSVPTPGQFFTLRGAVAVRPRWAATINGQCTPVGGTEWRTSIDPAHLPDSPPAPAESFGTAVLVARHAAAPIHRAPIRADPATGALLFTILLPADTAAGEYLLEANIAYKGDDHVTRVYDYLASSPFELPARMTPQLEITIAPNPGASSSTVPVFIDLSPTTLTCPRSS